MALTQSEMTAQLEQAIMLIDDVRNALENEDPVQAYRNALTQLNQVFDELNHPKQKDAQNEKKQVVEFGTPLLQSICNRIAKKNDLTLEKIEQYYELTPDAKKTVMLAIKMR